MKLVELKTGRTIKVGDPVTISMTGRDCVLVESRIPDRRYNTGRVVVRSADPRATQTAEFSPMAIGAEWHVDATDIVEGARLVDSAPTK